MKANEFIKDKGINKAKRHIELYGWRKTPFIIKLKRLVKSHELVEKCGGLDAANRIICDAFHGSNGDIPEGHEELSLAIQDVELCQ